MSPDAEYRAEDFEVCRRQDLFGRGDILPQLLPFPDHFEDLPEVRHLGVREENKAREETESNHGVEEQLVVLGVMSGSNEGGNMATRPDIREIVWKV